LQTSCPSEDFAKILTRTKSFNREICALSCTPEKENQVYAKNIVVGFWETNTVEVFKLDEGSFTFVSTTPPLVMPSLPSLPRSVLLRTFDSEEKYLIAGLADGTVVASAIRNKTLQERRVFSLGATSINLSNYTAGRTKALFASGSRAAVFSISSGTLRHSPVLVKVKPDFYL
jgi:DNA damage-binding protein 1